MVFLAFEGGATGGVTGGESVLISSTFANVAASNVGAGGELPPESIRDKHRTIFHAI
jgi:hypothetical protein